MRSIKEIRFRLRQKAANLRLFVFAPSLPADRSLPLKLPAPDSFVPRLRESPLAEEIENLAESICAHRFPLLGYVVETGPDIRWRRDYIHQKESEPVFFSQIPYLDPAIVGDHKIVWELNRHQHLVLLAQAWLLTGKHKFLDEIPRQLESWWLQNPFTRGVNWTSALEVAYRAFSWIWILHLAGPSLPDACQDRLRNELYRHGVYLEHNLSVYFSPNTHLLGEAVGLHALGALFPQWPRAETWRLLGGRIVAEEMQHQVREDGSHFEQSSAYHVYSTDLFLFHALLEPAEKAYLDRLRRMADYLAALTSPDGTIPLMGDDDGGRFFHPYGNRRHFGAATLATCCVFFGRNDWAYLPADLLEQAAWWCGETASSSRPGQPEPARARLFPDAKVAILSAAPAHIAVDVRAFGHANAGHSHAHALQVVCRLNGRDILIDPGTYTYVGEPEWRARFRGTAFHNTIRVDGLDQATGAGPFRWLQKPASEILRWSQKEDWCFLDATCTFHGFRHRRRLLWIPRCALLAVVDAVDTVEGDTKKREHRIQQFWHCGDPVTPISQGSYGIGADALLVVPPESEAVVSEGGDYGWQSEVPGEKVPRPVIIVERKTTLPALMSAILFLGPKREISLRMENHEGRIRLSIGDTQWLEFPQSGDPIVNLSHLG